MRAASMLRRLSAFVLFASWVLPTCAAAPLEVLIVVGPSNHPPGTHEVSAGGRLVAHCLENASGIAPVQTTLVDHWPRDPQLLERVDTVVFLGDQFPPHQLPESDRIMAELTEMMGRGCGIACVHFATGLRSPDIPESGEHPLLGWMGGYFASRGAHHQSIARIFPQATIEPPGDDDHPVLRGWETFTLHDEPYINNYFGPDQQMLRRGTIPFAVSQLPPESPGREIVSWGIEREDGGRGFAVVMPHFYRNWGDRDLRTLILNGVLWSAGGEIPAEGVVCELGDLNQFGPQMAVWPQPRPTGEVLRDYFADQVRQIEAADDLRRYQTLDQWQAVVEDKREQLAEMLGLRPEPPRTPLEAEIVGTIERDGIVVERLHYQSLPGLYVTANLYRPAAQEGPLPAVLYVCGHSSQQETVDGEKVSYGNKAGYQRHGAWLARHGYVCLTIDTIQLGEFLGLHHGTYREGRWDWLSLGYTPAGVEAWNGIRGLDYLSSRPEVDPERLAVTGRSGGGAYSWFVAALDTRVRAAVPVAGITDLRNHVIDRCVAGHCDCMFFVNYHRWDYATMAALVAPRALLLANSDRDSIFPLDGVTRVARQVQHIYQLYDAAERFGTWITPGPHQDTYELQVGAYRWLDRHLQQADHPIAEKLENRFDRSELKVFDQLPHDERVTTADALFAERLDHSQQSRPAAGDETAAEVAARIRAALTARAFSGWPAEPPALAAEKLWSHPDDEADVELWEFQSQPHVPLRAIVRRPAEPTGGGAEKVLLKLADSKIWEREKQSAQRPRPSPAKRTTVIVAPRGCGPLQFRGSEQEHTQWLRTYYLVGQTEAAMQTWDILRAVAFTRSLCDGRELRLSIAVPESLRAQAIYASAISDSPLGIGEVALPDDYLRAAPLLGAAQVVGLDAFLRQHAAAAERD